MKPIQMIETNDGFPARLRRAREFRGLSQVQLAMLADIPQSSICHFESGARSPSLNSFRSLCRVLNVDSEYLLNRTDAIVRTLDKTVISRIASLDQESFDAIITLINKLAPEREE